MPAHSQLWMVVVAALLAIPSPVTCSRAFFISLQSPLHSPFLISILACPQKTALPALYLSFPAFYPFLALDIEPMHKLSTVCQSLIWLHLLCKTSSWSFFTSPQNSHASDRHPSRIHQSCSSAHGSTASQLGLTGPSQASRYEARLWT